MCERQQFDNLLGGESSLPDYFPIKDFVSSRTREILALTEAIDDPQRVIVIPQKLPKHMQRRVMSHNPKRLPRKFREAHIDMQLKSGIPNVVKTPRRKYRRRPQNLLQEYNRRKRQFVWLETHIWHAKRFHMIEKWGYKLPNFPNDKSFRACYRACKEHCLLQDISYFSCIEIVGELDDILKGLNQLTSTECGLTFGAKCSLQGTRECSTTVFRVKEYPNGVIGTVKFMWKPPSDNSKRTLWVWCHAAYHSELFDELVKVFRLKNDECESMEVDSNVDPKLETRNVPSSKIPKYLSTVNGVTVSQLKDTLNRFRLTGPLSQPILTDLLRIIDPDKLNITDESLENARTTWAHNLLNKSEAIEILRKKKEFWEKMKLVTEPSQLPPHSIIPITVSDPRYHMPQIRTKQVSDSEGQSGIWPMKTISPDFVQDNPMWEPAIRDQSTAEKLSTAELNQIKSEQLVPGACDLEHIAPASFLPVVLIQNPGFKPQITRKGCSSKFGSGWDLVVPAGWAMPVWLGMVWRGARVGGLRESGSMQREAGSNCDLLAPDSAAGQRDSLAQKSANTDEFFRKPPAKRPNYIKLGIPTPFHQPWKELIRDWNGSDKSPSSFCVLRSIAVLQKLNNLLQELKNMSSSVLSERISEIGLEESSFLVAINVRMCKRGTLCGNSPLCLPSKDDVEKLKGNSTFMGPVEPSHTDIYEEERRSTRDAHQKELIRLRKRRKSAKDKNSVEVLKVLKERTELKVKEEKALMQRLWLPSEIGNLRNSCSREVIGFLEDGAFSYKEACSTGQGYIALTALLKFFSHWKTISSSKSPVILVRSPSSYQYSFAEVSIML
ncbi:ribonucleases P/MRP protein subunit POP1-like [Nilaparvata lugens]|uniref:ribonucleases P/MRP protein subunit POP1-like n=1 Tax=Nilaparvata lugens TaxID=108931 RepID=UPI00193DBCBA|nr:ribonucleases P/MRP protein subunit POP1-like [Nilaparvata lugens]